MVNLPFTYKLHNLCMATVLVTFSMACITMPVQTQILNIGFNEVALMVRLEKLVEKLWKQETKRNVNNMIDILLDVKSEIETATGNAIPIKQKLDQIYKEMQQKGYKPPKKQWESFKKKFKLKDKKKKHHAEYMAMILADPYGVFNANDEQMLYAAKHGHDKEDEDDKDEKKFELPVMVAFGITLTLCGVFLVCLPIPQAKTWGGEMIRYGLALAVEEGIRYNVDKDEKDENKK